MNGDVPVAATLNVAVCPAVTLKLAGCEVIVGATVDEAVGVTVRVAGVLVAVPIVFVTTTLNCDELSDVVTGGVTRSRTFLRLPPYHSFSIEMRLEMNRSPPR